MILEVIVTTRHADGRTHVAPMGVRQREDLIEVAPFRPSRTLDYLISGGAAVINFTDDVQVFAGCVTGRHDWPLVAARQIQVPRLADCLAHAEVKLERIEDDPVRPRLLCRPVWEESHRGFQGFNRAQAAVIELAILVSRRDRLSETEIVRGLRCLEDAVRKTAGPRELVAWNWLVGTISRIGAAGDGGRGR